MKTLNLTGATVDEITRDIKTGEFVLKSHGDIKGNLHAQTVIIYGNVSGDIHAEEVLVIEDKKSQEKKEKKKDCLTCKYFNDMRSLCNGSWICLSAGSEKIRTDLKICENYKKSIL